jgi:hypothetical protein
MAAAMAKVVAVAMAIEIAIAVKATVGAKTIPVDTKECSSDPGKEPKKNHTSVSNTNGHTAGTNHRCPTRRKLRVKLLLLPIR